MLNIFILEDMWDTRKEILTKDLLYLDYNIKVAENYEEAISLLNPNKLLHFNIFMLDHDLGFTANDAPIDKDNGLAVSKYIADNGIGKGKLFIIHSTNFYGAKNMAHELNRDGRIILIAPINLMRTMPLTYAELIQKHLRNP